MYIVIKRDVRAVLLALAVFACTGKQVDGQNTIDRLRSSCAKEAELLVSTIILYKEQNISNSRAIKLETGRFIYRCEKRNDWIAIMYPKAGEKVDCTFRKDEHQCPIGWVKGEVTTSNID